MQHIVNNLPDAFTNTKGVTKSSFPARYVPERIEVPNKTIQLPSQQEKGRSTAAPKAATSRKRTRKQRDEPSKPVNATQPLVEKDQVDIPNPHPTSIVHSNPMMGHRNTPTMLYWEILNSRMRWKKFPPIILILENHTTERL